MTANRTSANAVTPAVNPAARRASIDEPARPVQPAPQPPGEASPSRAEPRRSPPVSPRAAAMQRLQASWGRLAKNTQTRENDGHYIDVQTLLGDEQSAPLRGVRNTLIEIVTDPIKSIKKYINANRITLQRAITSSATPAPHMTYVVGKSPVAVADHHAVLLNAIESKQGLFQFVPRQKAWRVSGETAGNNAIEHSPSVLGKLLHEYEQAEQSGQRLTIGKYRVTKVTELASSPLSKDPAEKPNFHQRYLLDVQWQDEKGIRCNASVPISQVGLRFSGQLLRQEELETAQRVFNDHLMQNRKIGEPSIFSPAGIGRSATLMVHHEISRRIDIGLIQDENVLDEQIEQVIDRGRRDRSPDFVHSLAQLDVLRETLLKQLKKKQPCQQEKKSADSIAVHITAASPIDVPIPISIQRSEPPAAEQAAVDLHVAGAVQAAADAQVTAPSQTAMAGAQATAVAQTAASDPLAAVPAQAAAAASTIPPPLEKRQAARDRTIEELVTVLGQAAIETMVEINQLPKKFGSSSPTYCEEKLKFEIRVGELMRLQQVLLDMKVAPLSDETTISQRATELRETLDAVIDIQEDLERRAKASKGKQDDSKSCTPSEIVAATFEATEKLFELPQISEIINRVKNGGADATPRYDEGNNCLFVSILQHATGNYRDRFQFDMAKILREGLVAHTTTMLGEYGVKLDKPIAADTYILEYIMPRVNALFGRNLDLRVMTPGYGDEAQDIVRPGIYNSEKAATSIVEPILVLQNNFHFEAIGPAAFIATLPHQEPAESAARKAAREQQEKNDIYLSQQRILPPTKDIKTYANALQTIGEDVVKRIEGIAAERIVQVPLSLALVENLQGISPESLPALTAIHQNHLEKLRDEKMTRARDAFNDELNHANEAYERSRIIADTVPIIDLQAPGRLRNNNAQMYNKLVVRYS